MIPVLEVGGTHVSAALVDPRDWTVQSATRLELDADASAPELLSQFAAAAAAVSAPRGVLWGIAMPDPFDYVRGVGEFEGVGKFTSLRGVDVGERLRRHLGADVVFLNDADAFVLGEWIAGSVQGSARCAGITLGTGVGSGWLVDGVPVDPGVPPGGRIHRMDVAGGPLEDVVSRRAIRRAYAAAGGDPAADVREIAGAARTGEPVARRVLDEAMTALGQVVGRCVAGFVPDVLMIGGSMSASWNLFEPAFRAGAAGAVGVGPAGAAGAAGAGATSVGAAAVGAASVGMGAAGAASVGMGAAGAVLPEIRVAVDSDHAPLFGAALHAQRSS